MAASLRVVTLNFWGDKPPLERRLALALRQLEALAPDVIALQEVRRTGRGDETTADRMAAALGFESSYGRSFGDGDDEEGLAILSRHPIRERRVTRLPDERPREARILLSAQLATGAEPVWCHTTHLHWRLDDGLARERQVVAVDAAVSARAGEGPQILCGDFNATPDSDEIRFLVGLTTLAGRRTFYQDAWALGRPGEPGLTWSMENPHQSPPRTIPIDRRLDYIFVTPRQKDGRGTLGRPEVVLTERDESGITCSDHYGVLVDVQIAPLAPS